MGLPGVSIIMTPKDRKKQLDHTLETILAQNYPDLEIIIVEDRPAEAGVQAVCARNKFKYAARRSQMEGWVNPAPLLNHAIKMAEKEILLIQNAECCHDTPTVIEDLVAPIMSAKELGGPVTSTVALVRALNQDGSFEQWYSHPTIGSRARWISYFCQAVPRSAVLKIQGFEESFTGYGFEDDMFEFMLRSIGVDLRYATDALVTHQWHPKFTGDENNGGKERFKALCDEINIGIRPPIANWNKAWGHI